MSRGRRQSARTGETQPLLASPTFLHDARAHPQTHASLLSRVFITWLDPLLRLGNTRQLQQDDIWELSTRNQCEFAANLLHRHWIASGSLSFAFLRAFGGRYVSIGVLLALAYGCDLVGPYVLFQVVDLIGQSVLDTSQLTLWLGLLFVTRMLKALLFAFVYSETQVIALQFSSALKSIVFQKSLRLSVDARTQKSTAEIVNIYTTDVQNILMAAYFLHEVWVLPLEIIIALLMLFSVVGYATFAGLGVIFIVLLVNNALARGQARTFAAVMRLKDERMKVINELFSAMQIVKLNAWERKFAAKIKEVRGRELNVVWKYLLIGALNIFTLWGAPVFVSTATFAVYALVMHESLTAAKVFTALALFRLIQDPLRSLPRIITGLIQAGISVKRLVEFIDLNEVDPYAVAGLDNLDFVAKYEPQNIVVAVENATLAWDTKSLPLFRSLNLTVTRGEFVVIHGKVGSGKSSFCSVLLGDMLKRNGSVYVGGSVAYCSQQPWIQNLTIRNNILFGKPYDKRKYQKVIDACGLATDLAAFPAGDKTEIGQKGLNMSGGQKARISLARACYSDADIFILDSPLAAVDAIVQNEIFNKCLLGLLKNKTRLLVTHNPEIIASKYVDDAIRLVDGAMTHSRNVDKQVLSNPLVSPLIGSNSSGRFTVYAPGSRTTASKARAERNVSALEQFSTENVVAEGFSPLSTRSVDSFLGERDFTDGKDRSGRLVQDEVRQDGRVSRHVFMAYFRAVGGLRVVFFLIVVQCVWQLFQILSDFWLSHWTSESEEDQQTHVSKNLLIYVALALSGSVMVLVRTLTVSVSGIRGAKTLFDGMTASLLKAPMAFFDANPVGRILNRYGDDVSSVDFRLPFAYGTLLAVAFSNGCTLLTAAVVTRYFGVLIAPILYLYVRVGMFYLTPAREVQRLQKTSQSPVLAHVAEAIDGTTIIRAFGLDQMHRFMEQNFMKIDLNNRNVHVSIYAGQWFGLRMQLMGGVIVVVIAGALVALRNSLSVGVIGLAFNYALSVDQGLESLIQSWSWLETSMVSPERMQEYIDIPSEAPHAIPSETEQLCDPWPSKGDVVFDDVSFRYKQGGDLVLRNISLHFAPSEKIGIVGRTGAGKSSLTMALFRINELAAGRILIDGVDTSTLGLQTLRSSLSIITQAPVLFKGTIRGYLDPFDEFSDDSLWLCLRKASLSDKIAAMDGLLLAPLEENGENFSVGERQMLCMARALLSESRVVIMDEATAAIDHETDLKLQQVIREEFALSTVITIAHRLDTVLDADRILVLDGGQVAEFDAPSVLIARGHGHLYDLAKEGGYLDRITS
uniref:Multidrug resistance-associated protein 1 n=1 Tax=Globisporangium ultimum (strain ATCC 200006 / CBS 805.95 / DAOM BR144) TaxID=431595 RepID=K3XC94_GLOUD